MESITMRIVSTTFVVVALAINADAAKSQADRIGWYVAGAFRPVRFISDAEARKVIDTRTLPLNMTTSARAAGNSMPTP